MASYRTENLDYEILKHELNNDENSKFFTKLKSNRDDGGELDRLIRKATKKVFGIFKNMTIYDGFRTKTSHKIPRSLPKLNHFLTHFINQKLFGSGGIMHKWDIQEKNTQIKISINKRKKKKEDIAKKNFNDEKTIKILKQKNTNLKKNLELFKYASKRFFNVTTDKLKLIGVPLPSQTANKLLIKQKKPITFDFKPKKHMHLTTPKNKSPIKLTRMQEYSPLKTAPIKEEGFFLTDKISLNPVTTSLKNQTKTIEKGKKMKEKTFDEDEYDDDEKDENTINLTLKKAKPVIPMSNNSKKYFHLALRLNTNQINKPFKSKLSFNYPFKIYDNSFNDDNRFLTQKNEVFNFKNFCGECDSLYKDNTILNDHLKKHKMRLRSNYIQNQKKEKICFEPEYEALRTLNANDKKDNENNFYISGKNKFSNNIITGKQSCLIKYSDYMTSLNPVYAYQNGKRLLKNYENTIDNLNLLTNYYDNEGISKFKKKLRKNNFKKIEKNSINIMQIRNRMGSVLQPKKII